ncbi:hypothetical protein A2U01_0059328, partial [Trifolium medium]|nr:hypothetical protein [Trifolium medium]
MAHNLAADIAAEQTAAEDPDR